MIQHMILIRDLDYLARQIRILQEQAQDLGCASANLLLGSAAQKVELRIDALKRIGEE